MHLPDDGQFPVDANIRPTALALARLAEVLVKGLEVFGDRREVERWMLEPALALDSARPIDEVAEEEGVMLVKSLLDRLAYGVYV